MSAGLVRVLHGFRKLAASALLGVFPLAAETVASFDINDAVSGPYTLLGWTAVKGAANDADTITGSDGTHTLTLTTTGDGQDRERNSGSFPADADLWRDFWFVNGNSAVATISGLDANADHTIEIWAYDLWSTPLRSATWTDAATGNAATLAFDGGNPAMYPVPDSLTKSVAIVQAKSDGAGVVTLVASSAGGLPGIYVSGLRVSDGAGSGLVLFEAESAALGSAFETITLDGATAVGATSTIPALDAPGDPQRIASYTMSFPAAGTYHLYSRLRVGPGAFNDDSLFLANSFGVKSATDGGDWIFRNGLAVAGYTGAAEIVDAGGSAGSEIWKWIRLDGPFTVPEGALGQTYEIAGREDGLYFDRFVFAPAELDLTVAELENGVIDQTLAFDGPDGIAIHRFGEPNGGRTPDGAHPFSALAVVDGALVGTTLLGGSSGDGVAFRVSTDGEGFATLTSFIGAVNGAHPYGDFIFSGGVVTGASSGGGSHGTGAIFQRAADGTVTLLHHFASLDPHTGANQGGAVPCGPLASDGANFYGAALAGGGFSNGTLFSLSTSGFHVLHEFSDVDPRHGTNSDGAEPRGGLVLADGRLFGSTAAGGSGGSGVVFSVQPDGGGFTVLHHFAALDPLTGGNLGGAFPSGGLLVADGWGYGTTLAGGAGGNGAVFAIRTDGSEFMAIFEFPATLAGTNTDGARPAAGLVRSGNVLYGVASSGGNSGAGTVFALDTALPDFRTIHRFQPLEEDGTNRFGAHPVAPLIRIGPALYGTTFDGGPGRTGTVFRIPIPVSTGVGVVRQPNGTIDADFTARGAPHHTYLIQQSGDLETWRDVGNLPADASGIILVRETGLVDPARFYRIAEP
ncbi:MAG: hypothetical protein H7A50_04585 [Akkermansiaceae bacterium]|nr:hypothetical protein [Akkermansiaceae bacterium]